MTEEKNTQENIVNDIITLIDEDDNNIDFRLVDVMELDGQKYAVLQPCDFKVAGGELGEDEAVIFRLDKDENGEEVFAYIEDDKEWDIVVNTYNDMIFDEN
ncbi:MAG: DUF1292 domain-containing protein [Bacillota bacterium]|jgi:uncharacterized protein YrzB (UPF0473 family)